jgi:hypothetical protein
MNGSLLFRAFLEQTPNLVLTWLAALFRKIRLLRSGLRLKP